MKSIDLSWADDFLLDEYIECGLQRSIDAGVRPPTELLLRAVHEEWQKRHPDHLPPCFKGMKFPECYTGIRAVYEWPEA
jgi:hypothetical protein